MKKFLFYCMISVMLTACGGGSAPEESNSTLNQTTNTGTPSTSTPTTTTTTPQTNTTSGWVQIGTGVADVPPDGQNPSMALGNDGNPIVVYEGGTAGVGANWDIYVKRWNGQSWVQLGGTLDMDTTKTIGNPVVAVNPVSGNPVVAWWERSNTADVIYVKGWNGSSWISLGGALNIDSTQDARFPSIAIGQDGKPVVAWWETGVDFAGKTITRVHVKKWNGTDWSALGGAIGIDPIAGDPNVVIDPADGNPLLAYSQGDLVGSSSTYAGSVVVTKWNGSTWNGLGPEMKDFFTAEHPRLAVGSDGKPFVFWQEILSYSNTISIKKWDGSTWTIIPTLDPAGYTYNPSAAMSAAGRPVVSYRGLGHDVYVKEWDGTSWNQLGSVVSGLNDADYPALAIGADGKPVVAWQEFKYSYPDQIYVKKWQ